MKSKLVKHASWLFPVALLGAGCARVETQADTKPPTPVRVQAVETETSDEGPRYSGSVEPISRVDLAFRLGGYVEEILTVPTADGGSRLVHEGDLVEKGVQLVKLRQADYKTKVDQAISQLEQAKAGLEQTQNGIKQAEVGRDKAKLDFDRADALFKTQSLTKSDYDGAKAQIDNAQAVLDGAQSQLTLAKARVAGAQAILDEANLALHDSVLTSPVRGVVLKRLLEVGSLVGPGSPAFVIADLSTLKAVFGAPDVLLPSLKQAMSLALSTESLPGQVFNGRITSIAPTADPRSRVFDVEVTFPNPGQRLKPGMVVTVQIGHTRRTTPVPVVPLNAIVRSKNNAQGYAVFVIETQSGKSFSRARDVTLGSTRGGNIAVLAGLKAGELIVTTGAPLLRDGEAVQIVP